MALRDLGMPESGIAQAAESVVNVPYWNPRAVDRASIQAEAPRNSRLSVRYCFSCASIAALSTTDHTASIRPATNR